MGLPYEAILALACVLLAGRYLFDPTASLKGRLIVGILTGASFVLPEGLWWRVTAVVIQVAVSLFVLLRLKRRS